MVNEERLKEIHDSETANIESSISNKELETENSKLQT
jgi:hypothetical protein